VAELLGMRLDTERAIRWLIALMVLCYDPPAIASTAAASVGTGGIIRPVHGLTLR